MRTALYSLSLLILGLTFSSLMNGCVATRGGGSSGPVALHSPMLAASWEVETMDNVIRYRDPANSLNVLVIRKKSGPDPEPTEPPLVKPLGYGDPYCVPARKPYPQSWKYTTIAEQTVRWYQEDEGSGADYPAFRTETFPITNAKGKLEYYSITATSGMRGNYLADIDQMLRSVTPR